MKKSLILQLANIVLQNHYFNSDELWASFPGNAISSLPDTERKLVIQKYDIITANTIANLDMLTTLAVTTGEGDITVYPLLRDATRDFKASKVPPEPFNEVLRG
ncbi:hypothetical protein [Yersinia pekkanenii]|uniref:Uncharacterized protein n=1 Tax=Yersinia pekkanenii TaxID=1288385 RepID=A0A0T9QHL0_9GAMM|nr:hypothetical protein [Yersinia pekkanenii]CNI12186.1 Uncharacterised protein [Yersinia pekkanenii]CRY68399.1 Uncharacterised protein [Yersinia pekkanenii]